MSPDPDEGSDHGQPGPSSLHIPDPPAPAAVIPLRLSNSLLSYFGTGPRPTAFSIASSSNSTSTVTAPKPRKTKGVTANQALLGTSTDGPGGWALGRKATEEKEAAKPKGKKKVIKTDEGEEAERKEMVKRTKVEKKKTGVWVEKNPTNGGSGVLVPSNSASGAAEGSAKEGLSTVHAVTNPSDESASVAGPSRPRISETKRKRAAPPHFPDSQPTPPTHSQPIPKSTKDLSSILFPSSPPTINLSSSTESDGSEDIQPIPTSSRPGSLTSLGHPPFSRSSSGISKGASQDDAIDIEDSPLRKKVVIEISDSPIAMKMPTTIPKLPSRVSGKPVHAFFGKKPAVADPPVVSPVENVGGSATVVKPAAKEVKMNSFFQAGPKGVPGKLSDGWGGGRKLGEEWLTPFPGRTLPSHTGYTTVIDEIPGNPAKRRRCSPPSCGPLGSFFSTQHFATSRKISSRPAPVSPITSFSHIDHPAIRAIPHRSLKSARETWCERYRPLAADQVLGNETESTYLRDWLQLLSVGSDGSASSASKVIRRIPRRKAQLIDGWIEDDVNHFSDEEDPNEDEDEVEFEPICEPPSALDPRPDSYPDFGTRLANTTLLSGSHGCGKSAAVYAVAEELGWEVFEVYPGIGRRNGSNLMSLVGDVGRNHVITGQGKGKITPKKPKIAAAPIPKIKSTAASFFGGVAAAAKSNGSGPTKTNGVGVIRKRANQLPTSSQGSQGDPVQLADSDEEVIGDDVEILEDRKHGFRQTLILIDEADLLFDEEATFWPAVISLIAESRRPVILTCNDPERIPVHILPLQVILQYQPPPRDLAITYLHAIGKHELLPTFDPVRLYESCISSAFDLLVQPTPLPPNGHEPVPMFDLRKAITQMQLDRGNPTRPSSTSPERVECLNDVCAGLEQRSFADAWVSPRSWARHEMYEIDRYQATPDDLLGLDVLLKPEVHPDRPVLASYSYENEISAYLLSLVPEIPYTSDDLSLKQIIHIRSLLPLLDPLIPLSSNLLPHFSLFTDYIPILRSIVLADDLLEIAEEESLARGGERLNRKTGRPIRTVTGWLKGKEETGYVRYLKDVGKEGEDVVRHISLGSPMRIVD